MLDIQNTPKSTTKKVSKKKRHKQSDDFKEHLNVEYEPKSKRRRKVSNTTYQEPESTVPDESFMLPKEKVEATKQVLITTSSIGSDSMHSQPLSCVIGSRSNNEPESSLKHIWSHKSKVSKRNYSFCREYTDLEKSTLQSLQSAKVLKSKKKFLAVFSEFELSARCAQEKYKNPNQDTHQSKLRNKESILSSKLVKRSKKFHASKMSKKNLVLSTGSKDNEVKIHRPKYSMFFINEVISLAVTHKTAWDIQIIMKLIKTKQITSTNAKVLGLRLIAIRDVHTFTALCKYVKLWSAADISSILSTILGNPLYNDTVDGKDKDELNKFVASTLGISIDADDIKRKIKILSPYQAELLLTLINDKLINTTSVYSSSLTLNKIITWASILVECFFFSLTEEVVLIKQLNDNINLHLLACRNLFSLNEYLFRFKYPKKFLKK